MTKISIVTGKPLPPIRFFNTQQEEEHIYRELAQEHLPELSEQEERLLTDAGVTIHNFGEKAVEAIGRGDMELAEVITGKYVLPPQ